MHSWRAALVAACLLVSTCHVRAQSQFLPLLFNGDAKLTEEQAASVVGVWEQVDGFRLDGSVLDDAVRAAAEAAGTDAAASIDFEGVLANSSSPAAGALSFRLYIPAISASTGAFGAYYLIGPAGQQPAVTRVLGMGAATPDGVLLTGTKDEDTGLWYGLVRNETTMVVLYMEGLEAWDSKRTKVTDNQVVAQYIMAKLPAEEEKDALALVAVRNAEAGNESEVIAAADRKGRSG